LLSDSLAHHKSNAMIISPGAVGSALSIHPRWAGNSNEHQDQWSDSDSRGSQRLQYSQTVSSLSDLTDHTIIPVRTEKEGLANKAFDDALPDLMHSPGDTPPVVSPDGPTKRDPRKLRMRKLESMMMESATPHRPLSVTESTHQGANHLIHLGGNNKRKADGGLSVVRAKKTRFSDDKDNSAVTAVSQPPITTSLQSSPITVALTAYPMLPPKLSQRRWASDSSRYQLVGCKQNETVVAMLPVAQQVSAAAEGSADFNASRLLTGDNPDDGNESIGSDSHVNGSDSQADFCCKLVELSLTVTPPAEVSLPEVSLPEVSLPEVSLPDVPLPKVPPAADVPPAAELLLAVEVPPPALLILALAVETRTSPTTDEQPQSGVVNKRKHDKVDSDGGLPDSAPITTLPAGRKKKGHAADTAFRISNSVMVDDQIVTSSALGLLGSQPNHVKKMTDECVGRRQAVSQQDHRALFPNLQQQRYNNNGINTSRQSPTTSHKNKRGSVSSPAVTIGPDSYLSPTSSASRPTHHHRNQSDDEQEQTIITRAPLFAVGDMSAGSAESPAVVFQARYGVCLTHIVKNLPGVKRCIHIYSSDAPPEIQELTSIFKNDHGHCVLLEGRQTDSCKYTSLLEAVENSCYGTAAHLARFNKPLKYKGLETAAIEWLKKLDNCQCITSDPRGGMSFLELFRLQYIGRGSCSKTEAKKYAESVSISERPKVKYNDLLHTLLKKCCKEFEERDLYDENDCPYMDDIILHAVVNVFKLRVSQLDLSDSQLRVFEKACVNGYDVANNNLTSINVVLLAKGAPFCGIVETSAWDNFQEQFAAANRSTGSSKTKLLNQIIINV
jgi:hypothetical protein